jgi:hypothetical protein
MAQVIVRDLEKSVILKLKRRAAKDGVSMEEELRRIIRQSVAIPAKPKLNFKEFLLSMPYVEGDDAFFERQRDLPREIDLG